MCQNSWQAVTWANDDTAHRFTYKTILVLHHWMHGLLVLHCRHNSGHTSNSTHSKKWVHCFCLLCYNNMAWYLIFPISFWVLGCSLCDFIAAIIAGNLWQPITQSLPNNYTCDVTKKDQIQYLIRCLLIRSDELRRPSQLEIPPYHYMNSHYQDKMVSSL